MKFDNINTKPNIIQEDSIMEINKIISFDLHNLLKKPYGVDKKYLETYKHKILGAIDEVKRIRRDGKGPDGSLVLFPHLPYLLEENVLISEEEKKCSSFFKRKSQIL